MYHHANLERSIRLPTQEGDKTLSPAKFGDLAIKVKRMENSWITQLCIRFRCLGKPLSFTKLDAELISSPRPQPTAGELERWDVASTSSTFLILLEIIICIRQRFTVVFLADIKISKFFHYLELNSKHKDRNTYVMYISYQSEHVGITFYWSIVMTKASLTYYT
jgi:hypothetical protein